MKVEELLPLMLFTSIGLFIIRWAINWNLLNMVNGTSFSMFRANYSISEFFGLFKHIAISEWKLWWLNLEDERTMKIASNVLSTAIYVLILGIILTFIIKYKL